jgi:hypothetical protein
MEYFADHVEINPLNTYLNSILFLIHHLLSILKQDHYFCASPERYLKKIGKSSSRNLSKVPQNDTPAV